MTKRVDPEDRKQQQLRRLGTQRPICRTCGQTHPATFENHHIAGRKHNDDEALVCANCHRILSDKQRDHAPHELKEPWGRWEELGTTFWAWPTSLK